MNKDRPVINYGSFDLTPRRRPGRLVLIAVPAAALAIAMAVLLVGRSFIDSSHARATMAVHRLDDAVTAPARDLTLGACLDPTLSLVPSFATDIRADLAQAAASLAPRPGRLPTNAARGQPVTRAQPSVYLTIRQVTTHSFSSASTRYLRTVTVPGILGLARPQPEPGSHDYVQQLRAWYGGYGIVAAARRAAAKAAASAARVIAALPLERKGWSGISACVSALLATLPPGGRHSYLLASDLQENRPPVLAGSFRGAPLVIVQACDTGNASYCQWLLERFTGEMRKLDVGPITVVRPEVADPAIEQWIHGEEITS